MARSGFTSSISPTPRIVTCSVRSRSAIQWSSALLFIASTESSFSVRMNGNPHIEARRSTEQITQGNMDSATISLNYPNCDNDIVIDNHSTPGGVNALSSQQRSSQKNYQPDQRTTATAYKQSQGWSQRIGPHDRTRSAHQAARLVNGCYAEPRSKSIGTFLYPNSEMARFLASHMPAGSLF
jgi:hypothetical protein